MVLYERRFCFPGLPIVAFIGLVVVATFLLPGAPVQAQETWGASPSSTAQNLWGVAARPAESASGVAVAPLFVAVGEGGTLLTSPDGLAWTSRSSGTTRWLTGVSYAEGRFIAVGDAGTLLTSADGLTWTPRATGTTQRLNAVAFGRDRWLAVGENGTLVGSTDAVTWRTISPANPKPTGWLRGLTHAYGRFVFTGEKGAIFTTADTVRFFDDTLPTAASIEGLAYARHRFVATGSAGLVLTSPDATTWRGSHAGATLHAVAFFNNQFVGAGDNGIIAISTDASEWSTRPTPSTALLTALASDATTLVAVGFSGTILRARATAAAPTIFTAPADVTEAAGNHVRLDVTATGSAPLTYQWTFDGRPIPGATADTLGLTAVAPSNSGRYAVTVSNSQGAVTSPAATLAVIANFAAPTEPLDPFFVPPTGFRGAPSALLVEPDGRILAATGNVVARLTRDGSPDASFAAQSLPGVTAIHTLARQPDGKILAGGTTAGGVGQLARLNSDGTIDPAFVPPSASLGSSVTSLALQPDGKIAVANGTSRVVRLDASGAADPTFAGADMSSFTSRYGSPPTITRVALAPDGKIVFAATPVDPNAGAIPVNKEVLVARLNADGSLDPAFTPVRTGTLRPILLTVMPDGRILLASEDNTFSFNAGRWKLQRLNVDGTDDLSFLAHTAAIAKYGGNTRATIDARGRIVVLVAFQNARPGFNALRFTADGAPDTTLRTEDTSFGGFGNQLNAIAADPDGRVLYSRGLNQFARLVDTNAPRLNPPVPLADVPPPLGLTSGNSVTATARMAGTGPLSYAWTMSAPDGSSPLGSFGRDADSVTLSNVRVDSVLYTTATNQAGTLSYPAQVLRVPPSPPIIVQFPANFAVEAGRAGSIKFTAGGSGPLTYRWLFNGMEISSGVSGSAVGEPGAASVNPGSGTLQLINFNAGKAGQYQLVLSNALGSATATATVSLDPVSRLINVATRGFVGTGEGALFAGFVISGAERKRVMIRGIGPGLAQFGLTDFLADPQLTLFDASGSKLEENDDWVGGPGSFSISDWPAMFNVAPSSHDAIIERQLPPGAYTVQLSGVAGATGTALVEVYEQLRDTPRLINLSSRVYVGTDTQVAIAGVVASGQRPKTLLIRAVGPTLSQFGLSGALTNPTFTLTDAAGLVVAANDDWETNPNVEAIRAASAHAGAFALSAGARDAAVLVTVPPGSYTVLVSGVDRGRGVALVEVYEVP